MAVLPQARRSLDLVRQQIDTLKKEKVKDIIELQQALEQERAAQMVVRRSLQLVESAVANDEIGAALDDLRSSCDPQALVVGRAEFEAILVTVAQFVTTVAPLEASIAKEAAVMVTHAKQKLAEWRAKEQTTLRAIEEKKRSLELKGVKVNLEYFKKLAIDEARLAQEVEGLSKWKPHLENLEKERRILMRERWAVRDRTATKRNAFAQRANTALREALLDLRVSLKFDTSTWSPEAKAIITEAMNWRTVQVPRADLLLDRLTLPVLLDVVAKKTAAPIVKLTTDEGVRVFDGADAARVLERLGDPSVRFELEACRVTERPRLNVTKESVDANGKKQYRTRDFRRLSLGQQQSVLLHCCPN